MTAEIWEAARALFEDVARVPPREVRLLGVSISRLGGAEDRQMSLFGEKDHERARRIDAAVDGIVDRLGRGAIRRAAAESARRRRGVR